MVKKKTDALEGRSFGLLGISEAEERAYRWLLAHPRATAGEVSHALSLSTGKTRQLLSAIEAKGLVTRTPERPCHYLPVEPDIGLESLILQRQAELQHMRGAVTELQRSIGNPWALETKPAIELVSTQTAVRQVFGQANFLAQHEILCFTRLPLLGSRLDVPAHDDHYEQYQAQTRGVKMRTIVDTDFLAMPLALKRIHADMAAGEEVRVAPTVPLKMVLVDRQLAVILQRDGLSLILRYTPLLDALHELFELSWRQAIPVALQYSGALKTATCSGEIPRDVEEILPLLATGLNDKSIIHELGVSRATFGRHVKELMKILNASSRFQLGWLAAERFSTKISKRK